MKLNLLSRLSGLFIAVFLITACEGPEGPQGPAGQQGPAGTKGDTGVKGEAGAANVVYSEWLNIPTAPARKTTHIRTYEIRNLAALTNDALNTSTILTYGRLSADPSYIAPLPTNVVLMSNDVAVGTYLIKPFYLVGSIYYVEHLSSNGTPPASWINKEAPYYNQLRYIIIPGGKKARVAGLDYSDYQAVIKYYGLQD